MRVLICSIIRNREPFLFGWKDQILCLKDENPGITFDLSVFENDSTDGTVQYLSSIEEELDKELNNVWITCVKKDWPYFSSIRGEERVKYLAQARNECLEQADKAVGLKHYDKVVFIEPDIDYDPEQISQLFWVDDDIASPYSLHPMDVQSHRWIYDSWATRLSVEDDIFKGPRIFEMPPRLDVVATFNCFCVYYAKPFAEGARFSGINPWSKTWDCDTTNICYEFSMRGYDRIGLYNIGLTHLGN
jgi:glycosyltransferase involved in cell wall biosynthesis